MKQFAFVSGRSPTPEQIALAGAQDIELHHVGDMNSLNISPVAFAAYQGVAVVHSEVALILIKSAIPVGVFKKKSFRIHYPIK